MSSRPAGGYRPVELAAAGTGLLLPILFVTSFQLASWAPRAALVPVVATAGLVPLAVLVAEGRRSALLAAAFTGWAAMATLWAPTWAVAFWGRYSVGTGLVFVLALSGAWALGASIRPSAASLIERALLAACLINTGVALLQQVVDLGPLGLSLYGGRSAGLFGNPVYLAELLAGGMWLAISRLGQPPGAPRRLAALTVVILGVGVALTGSRFGLGLALVAVAVAAPRLGRRAALGAAALVALGLVLGAGLAHAGISGGGTTGLERAESAPASGWRPRLETWRSALPAIDQRPLLGWGPSGFLAGTSPHRTLALARAEGPDRLFADAHNVLVEYAVTTGWPGVALFVAWVGAAIGARRRDATGRALTGFGLLCLAMMLVEPLHVGTTPVAFLALGAAAAVDRPRRAPARSLVAAASCFAALGVAAAGTLATGLIQLRQADLNGDPPSAARATRLLPAWSAPAALVASTYGFLDLDGRDPVAGRAALRWSSTAARRDPADPAPWISLGDALHAAGDSAGALAAYRHALQRNPWSAITLAKLAGLESRLGQAAQAAELTARLRQVRPA